MAKKNEQIIEPIKENISIETMENIMGDRYATYAKYVIQDRAIPDVRDGLKPVQRRIIFSMFKNGNTFNKPTRKCAHTVGAVMGTFHPHGDTSIYEALARMSQDWKVRYPLIDFQGNNGSIDGDQPAAYRYTEARLSELSNLMIKNIDKDTVDMQWNFDDSEKEPVVLPSRFPNLFINGTEGIAVALATEIPPHNLNEVVNAIIYRIGHKTATVEDLMEFVKGPDFPGGANIYNGEGLKNIYVTGRGRIEISSKCEIVENKDNTQIVITEIPYKVIKSQLVFEIDKIIHSKIVSGLLEIRDESDWKGIRIVVDCKKDAKVDLLLKYLMNKTPLVSSYSANMVAIVNGRPKTLNLLDYVDAYISHQVDVITRQSIFDKNKFSARLHIVEGLIKASLMINEIVEVIKKSNDKADSKINLMNKYGFSQEQAEAIVTMPLYKLSHTDEEIFENEKQQLLKDIEFLNGVLEDPNKLNRLLIKELKEIVDKYGDERRTQIIEKINDSPIDKRELIAKEETMVAVSRDGYIKRSSLKSYKGSGDNAYPGLKDGDCIVTMGKSITTDYLVCFTNQGNYACIPVHKLAETKWKDEGTHINSFVTLNSGEKIIKAISFSDFRNDLYLAILTKYGQIKRMCVSSLDNNKRSRPIRCMRLLSDDEVIGVQLLSGNSDIMVLTSNGNANIFNENELTILSSKASGVKSISGLTKTQAIGLFTFTPDTKEKLLIVTNLGHQRILNSEKVNKTARLGKPTQIMQCFKNDVHKIIGATIIYEENGMFKTPLYLSTGEMFELVVDDLHMTEITKYAKKNIEIPSKVNVNFMFDTALLSVDKSTISFPVNSKTDIINEETLPETISSDESLVSVENKDIASSTPTPNDLKSESNPKTKTKSDTKDSESFEQISIFDDLE